MNVLPQRLLRAGRISPAVRPCRRACGRFGGRRSIWPSEQGGVKADRATVQRLSGRSSTDRPHLRADVCDRPVAEQSPLALPDASAAIAAFEIAAFADRQRRSRPAVASASRPQGSRDRGISRALAEVDRQARSPRNERSRRDRFAAIVPAGTPGTAPKMTDRGEADEPPETALGRVTRSERACASPPRSSGVWAAALIHIAPGSAARRAAR